MKDELGELPPCPYCGATLLGTVQCESQGISIVCGGRISCQALGGWAKTEGEAMALYRKTHAEVLDEWKEIEKKEKIKDPKYELPKVIQDMIGIGK